jgi:general L-amino acid transport system permease protein
MDPVAAPEVLPIPEPERPPVAGPGDWVRRNLFRSPLDGVVTVVSAAIVGYVVYRLARYVLVTGRWDIVRDNLKLFMVGRYPADELWRLAVAVAAIAAYGGLVAGSIHRRQVQAGTAEPPTTWWRRVLSLVARLWPLLFGVLLLLSLTTTVGPWLAAAATVAAGVVGRLLGGLLPRRATGLLVLLGVVGAPALVWFLSRPISWDEWGGMMLNLFLAVAGIALCFPLGVLLALGRSAGRATSSSTSGGVLLASVLAGVVIGGYVAVGGGFDLASAKTWVVLAAAAALGAVGWFAGRRSTLPVVRALSTAYIELFRGVPLFVLLLMSCLALGFFVPAGSKPPGLVVRAIVALTLFTAAYVAEIVRGGLQSLPKGQTEAAQALGLSPVRITGWIVLPQALRNVIPAMVGQFISLFKDTTLAGAAFGFFDVLNVSGAANAQEGFRGQNLTAETLSFVMLVFWIGCITMSRESQRLETKLGVGTR